jgi:hypothetical protein
MSAKGRLAVKFQERAALGKFCLALYEEDVPFTLAGFKTVVLAEKDFRALSPRLQKIISDFGTVNPTRRGEKHAPLPTREETQDLLRKFVTKS